MKPPHIKEQRQKEVRRLQKRRRQIWQLQRELGYIKLEIPIRHGWYKEIVITERVERYKNSRAIIELYDKLEQYYWGRTKKEADDKWQSQTSAYLIYKELPTLSKRQYNKLSTGAQKLCTPFQFYNERKKLRVRFYIRFPKGVYKIKYSKAYITHRKRIDPELECEYDLISQRLEKPEYYSINQRVCSYKDYWNLSELKKEKLKTQQHLRGLKKYNLKDVIKDTIVWERN